MALSQSFLDELLYRCDIVSTVSRYVQLKKSGANYFGLCPFHNEKTPSFSVSSDKQIFHCFGCGEGGNALTFVMRMENLPFIEAVKALAQSCGMTMPEDDFTPQDTTVRRKRMLALNREAARFFHGRLFSPAGAGALSYLRDRGLEARIIKRFGLGCLGDSWDELIRAMGDKGFSREELEQAWLARRSKSGGHYDSFRGRVIFPIIDVRGDVIAFGGRIMEGQGPKYLNSGDTMVFHKSRSLFALNLARRSKRDYLLLCEGYMDVIALHMAGFDCAVASLGTALTSEQARLIANYKKKVVIVYDSDAAGKAAAKKAIGILDRAGLAVRVLDLRGAKDPDEFIAKNGRDKFELLLERPQTGHEYRLEQIRAEHDVSAPEGRIAYLAQASHYIAQMPNQVEREIFAEVAASVAQVSREAVLNEIKRQIAKGLKKQRHDLEREAKALARGMVREPGADGRLSAAHAPQSEQKLVALLLQNEDLIEKAAKLVDAGEFSSEIMAKIFVDAIDMYSRERRLSPALLMSGGDDAQNRLLSQILASAVHSDDAEREMNDYIAKIKYDHIQKTADAEALLRLAAERKKTGGAAK